jgi:hypothetical protein
LNITTESSESEISAQASAALELADLGSIEQCVNALLRCEREALLRDFPTTARKAQIVHWIMLQRATILRDSYQIAEAKAIFQSVRTESLSVESACNGTLDSCQFAQLVDSTFGWAESICDEGNLHAAIWILRNLYSEISSSHREPSHDVAARIALQVDSWGNLLGYSHAAKILGIFTSSEQKRPVKYSDSAYPFPLHGAAFSKMKEQFIELSRLAAIKDNNQKLSLRPNRELAAFSKIWARQFRYSAESQRHAALISVRLAKVNVDLNQMNDLYSDWQSGEVFVQALLENVLECDYAKLRMVHSLSSLDATIVERQFDDELSDRTYVALGFLCSSAARTVLDEILPSGVDQAKALEECMLSALLAVRCDISAQPERAYEHRVRRDEVLRQILIRDPKNELAQRLRKQYKNSEVPKSVDVEQEIQSWNWRIVPLAQSDIHRSYKTHSLPSHWKSTSTK